MTAVLPTLGSAALIAALITYIMSWIAYRGIDLKDSDPGLPKARKYLFYAVISLSVAGFSLLWLLFAHAYQVEYVYAHVSNDLPALYVLSAFWAGQEGSFLIWAILAALLAWALARYSGEWEVPVMKVYLPSAAALVVMTLISGLFSLLPQIPAEGAGLNPLLRDPWMAIHPPVTFLGYAALSIPFAFAMAGLGRKRNEEWIDSALPWSLLGWVTLGTGVIMGGFWAYKVLGWGGWWGWDPVENASLLPWLLGMALFHGMLLQRSRKKLARTNVVLAILTFALVIYSTFLTRSGVLEGASVHTFGASKVGTWLFVWMVAVIGYGFYRITGAGEALKGEKLDEQFFSREMQLTIGTLVIIGITVLIGLGTSAPIISKISGGEGAAIDISYYGRTTLPLAILMALGIGLSVLIRWRGGGMVGRQALIVSVSAGLIGAVAASMCAGAGREPLHLPAYTLKRWLENDRGPSGSYRCRHNADCRRGCHNGAEADSRPDLSDSDRGARVRTDLHRLERGAWWQAVDFRDPHPAGICRLESSEAETVSAVWIWTDDGTRRTPYRPGAPW